MHPLRTRRPILAERLVGLSLSCGVLVTSCSNPSTASDRVAFHLELCYPGPRRTIHLRTHAILTINRSGWPKRTVAVPGPSYKTRFSLSIRNVPVHFTGRGAYVGHRTARPHQCARDEVGTLPVALLICEARLFVEVAPDQSQRQLRPRSEAGGLSQEVFPHRSLLRSSSET